MDITDVSLCQKETFVSFDHFIRPESPWIYSVPQGTRNYQLFDDLNDKPTQASFYQLKSFDAYFILWRVFGHDRVLELRLVSLMGTKLNPFFLDQPVKSTVHFVFPARILPKVTILESVATFALGFVVVLENKELHRVLIPLKDLFHVKPRNTHPHECHQVASLYGKKASLVHALDYDNVVIGCEDGAIFYIFYDRNSVVPRFREDQLMNKIFDQLVENFQIVRDMPKNIINRVFAWPSSDTLGELVSNSMNELSLPVTFTSYQNQLGNWFVIWVCQNRQVRVWSLHKNRDHLGHLPNLGETGGEQECPPIKTGSVIRVIEQDDPTLGTFNFVVSMPLRDKSVFLVYRVDFNSSGDLKSLMLIEWTLAEPAQLLTINANSTFIELVDFSLDELDSSNSNHMGMIKGQGRERVFKLWAVFDRQPKTNNSTITTTTFTLSILNGQSHDGNNIRCEFSKTWDIVTCPEGPLTSNQAYISYELHSGTTDKDIDAAFLGFIFYPGLFSKTSIYKGLKDYTSKFDPSEEAFGLNNSNQGRTSQEHPISPLTEEIDLRQWASDLMRMGIAGLNGMHNEVLTKNYLILIEICQRYESDARKPLSLCSFPSWNLTAVINGGGLSLVRNCETSEILENHISPLFNQNQTGFLQSRSIETRYPLLGQAKDRVDILNILKATSLLVDHCHAFLPDIEKRISEALSRASTSSPLTIGVEQFYEQFMGDIDRELFSKVRAQVQACERWPKAIRKIIEVLNYSDLGMIHSRPGTSILADALIASATSEIIRTRYTMSRNFLLLLVFMVKFEKSDIAKTYLAQCFTTHYSQSILRWIAGKAVPSGKFAFTPIGKMPVTTTSDNEDDIINALSNLSLESIRLATGSMSFLRYSLLHSILHYKHRVAVDGRLPTTELITTCAGNLLHKLGFFANNTVPMVVTKSSFIEFGNFLESTGQLSLLYQYLLHLVGNPAASFLRGRLYLKCGMWNKAQKWFEKAAVGYVKGLFTLYTYPPIVSTQLTSLVDYWRYVASEFRLYDRHSNVVQCCHLALRAFNNQEGQQSPEGKALMIELWNSIFKHALLAESYDEAFLAMMENPDDEKQKAYLHELVETMCQNDEAHKLCQFAFYNLEEEFRHFLEIKAEKSLAAEVPNYSMVAYTYYISRQDYVKAARVVYQFAKKIDDSNLPSTPPNHWITQQTQNYLVAINALELVDDKYAWFEIEVPRRSAANDGRKRKRQKLSPPQLMDDGVLFGDQTVRDIDIVELIDIKREYAISLIKLKLESKFRYKEQNLELDTAIALCAETGNFEDAFFLAQEFGADMSEIFRSLTVKCVRISTDMFGARNISSAFVSSDLRVKMLYGSDSERAWKLLQIYLDKYDTPKETNCRYRTLVLGTILNTNENYPIPRWLTASFEEHHPDSYLNVMLKHGCVSEASRFTLDIIQRELEKPRSSHSFSRWLPWNLIQRLNCEIEDVMRGSTDDLEFMKGLYEKLQQRLEEYLNFVKTS